MYQSDSGVGTNSDEEELGNPKWQGVAVFSTARPRMPADSGFAFKLDKREQLAIGGVEYVHLGVEFHLVRRDEEGGNLSFEKVTANTCIYAIPNQNQMTSVALRAHGPTVDARTRRTCGVGMGNFLLFESSLMTGLVKSQDLHYHRRRRRSGNHIRYGRQFYESEIDWPMISESSDDNPGMIFCSGPPLVQIISGSSADHSEIIGT
ncbi:hypothetical protein FB45DRAFT_880512 [Roridomyces roridus]|uniref:Uncharacterized protein n=1 Tax=Roridomyces roridus TaxID=1738132 RepID=A0AAD7F960_9AGAR|nr:hypothetical protein FB45DRAFT_880512 [Roridomyces roridus]